MWSAEGKTSTELDSGDKREEMSQGDTELRARITDRIGWEREGDKLPVSTYVCAANKAQNMVRI